MLPRYHYVAWECTAGYFVDFVFAYNLLIWTCWLAWAACLVRRGYAVRHTCPSAKCPRCALDTEPKQKTPICCAAKLRCLAKFRGRSCNLYLDDGDNNNSARVCVYEYNRRLLTVGCTLTHLPRPARRAREKAHNRAKYKRADSRLYSIGFPVIIECAAVSLAAGCKSA